MGLDIILRVFLVLVFCICACKSWYDSCFVYYVVDGVDVVDLLYFSIRLVINYQLIKCCRLSKYFYEVWCILDVHVRRNIHNYAVYHLV